MNLRIVSLLLPLCMFSAVALAKVTTYHFPDEIKKSHLYEVSVVQEGQLSDAFVHLSECPEQVNPREKILPMLYDRTLSWTNFTFEDGAVEIVVKKNYGELAKDVIIAPNRAGARINWFDGHTVSFTLDTPEYVSVRFVCEENSDEYDQIRHALMVFADEPETDIPNPEDADVLVYSGKIDPTGAKTIYFGPGVYDLTEELPNGMLPLHDNQEVYIHPEAFVYGGIQAPGTYNVKVYGRGVLCGTKQPFHYPGLPQILELEPWNYRSNVHRGGYATVKGITLLESFNHNVAIPPHSYVKNLKIMAWKVNNDGIRPGDHCIIDHVFMKVSDDHLYAFGEALITNSLFWPMWNGAILQLSWGDYGGAGTRFMNNTIINAEWNQLWHNNGVIASQARPDSINGKILIQDLYVEGDLNALANLHFSSFAKGNYDWYGHISDITFRNVEITGHQIWLNEHQTWYDHISDDLVFDMIEGEVVRGGKSYIGGYISDDGNIAPIHHIVFENVKIGGTQLTEKNHSDFVAIDPKTTHNIRFIDTNNFDSHLSHRPGYTRSNEYHTERTGAGRYDQGHKDPSNPYHSGWLKKGENASWTVDLPQPGLYDIKFSVGSGLADASFKCRVANQETDTFEISPITDNGYNFHKLVTQKPVELTAGECTLVLEVTDGICQPDYIEITPHTGEIPEVDVKVTSVSVMRIAGDDWIGAGLNVGVVPDELRFNSRHGVVINADERGPREPIPASQVSVFDRSGEELIHVRSNDLVRNIDISRIPHGPYLVLFTDRKSFWIAKQIVK
ncbi:MAG: hypothetical protein MI748_21440 [Opitutales bacterium]|nr:hypothetical protein [Opitutales bacterium]